MYGTAVGRKKPGSRRSRERSPSEFKTRDGDSRGRRRALRPVVVHRRGGTVEWTGGRPDEWTGGRTGGRTDGAQRADRAAAAAAAVRPATVKSGRLPASHWDRPRRGRRGRARFDSFFSFHYRFWRVTTTINESSLIVKPDGTVFLPC